MARLASYANDRNDLIDEMKWLFLAGEAKDPDAESCWKLSRCYLTGRGVERDAIKALEWSYKAAECGWPEAQLEQGKFAHRNKDMAKAIMWLELAASGNNAEAQYLAGIMYYNDVVPSDAPRYGIV
jgi:hypothetical protein